MDVQVNVIADVDHTDQFMDEVKAQLILDPVPQGIIRKVKNGKADQRYSLRDNLLWFDSSRLVIPSSLRIKILKDHHDAPLAGHPASKVTRELIARNYHWPGLDQDIDKFVASCDLCQRNKDQTKKPAGLLQSLLIPSTPWESISMDFITHLPKTKLGHDCITVFVVG